MREQYRYFLFSLLEIDSLPGNQHLLRCNDMWRQLLDYYGKLGIICNADKFLSSANRVSQRQARSQQQQ